MDILKAWAWTCGLLIAVFAFVALTIICFHGLTLLIKAVSA